MMLSCKVGQCFQPVCHTLVSNARNLFVHFVTFCGQSISVSSVSSVVLLFQSLEEPCPVFSRLWKKAFQGPERIRGPPM